MNGPFQFCPGCGVRGGQWLGGREYRCPACHFRFFQNVALASGVLVEHQGRFLFVERARDPAKGLLCLPGGFVDPGEGIEQALAREIAEELGAVLGTISYLGSHANHYPFAGVDYQTCDLYFQSTLTDVSNLKADPSEVSALHWLTPSEVRLADLAFPSLRTLWARLHPKSE